MRGSTRLAGLALLLASCSDPPLMQVDAHLLADPPVIDFGQVPLHGQAQRTVRLTNAGRAPLRVNGLAVELQGATQALSTGLVPFSAQTQNPVPITLGTDRSTTLQVSFVPTVAGTLRGELRVDNDTSPTPEGVVELRAEAVDAQATVGTSQLDFGKLEVGTSATQGLTMVNDSPLDVVVTPAPTGTDSDEFASQPITVPAHQHRLLPVTFAPTRVSKVRSTLSVTRCAGCEATEVDLYGEGIESALVVDPNPMQFGSVPIDASADVACRLINVSSQPLELHGVALGAGADPGYQLLQQVPDSVIAPGGWLATAVRFTPTHLGEATGTLVVSSNSHRHPELPVSFLGRGGGAEIATSPEILDFGDVPVGAEATGVIHVRNAGTGADLLTVQGATIAGPADFTLAPNGLPLTLAAGDAIDLTVRFDPTQAGVANGTVTIDSSDGSAPHEEVALRGNGVPVAPCSYALVPSLIDFGNVPPGSGAVLGLRFTNQGTDLCVVRDVHLAQDAQGAFFLPGGPLQSLTLWPGDAFEAQVAFKPNAAGAVTGALTMQVSDPANPTATLPLFGNSQPACLYAAPPFIDFGPLRSDCPHPDRSTHYTNGCAAPVTVNSIWLGDGTSGEFGITHAPAVPLNLAPGDGFTVSVDYAAQQVGQNFTPLFVAESDVPNSPLLVPLLGEGMSDGRAADHFVQADGTRADVLFVVDNSNSMAEEQPRLQAAVPAFIQGALSMGMDLHVGVTTTGIDPVTTPGCGGGASGGEAGRLFPVDGSNPRIIDLTLATPEAALQANLGVGLCHHLEQGLEAMRRALSSPLSDHADDPRTAQPNDGNLGFLRADAQLSVVVLSDEDDRSGDAVPDYAAFLRTVKGTSQPQRVGFFAIAPLSSCGTASGSSAPRYQQMAQATGGEVWDVCSADYGPALASVAQRAFGPQTRFPLSRQADPASVQVNLDGQPAAAGSWSFDAAADAVVFTTAPAPGTIIDVTYVAVCGP